MKKSLDKFNTFVQREYGYLYDFLDTMRSIYSCDLNVEKCIEEIVKSYTNRLEMCVLRMLDDLNLCTFEDEGPVRSSKNGKYVFVSKGTSEIEKLQFFNNSNVEMIVIPEGVTKVGDHAFEGCNNLKHIILPKGITTIGAFSFCDCTAIERIILPDSVISIGYGALCGCTSLREIVLPFVGNKLNAEAPRSSVFGYIFGDCVRDGTMHREETKYRTSEGSGYTSQITENDDSKSYYYYSVPSSLRRVEITKQIDIPDYAFCNCDLIEEIILPDDVEASWFAFCGCWGLKTILPDQYGDIFRRDSVNSDYFVKHGVLKRYKGSNALVRIPYDVHYVEKHAFKTCSNLEKVIFPRHVRSIEKNVFSDCTNLKELDIRGAYIYQNAFKGCSLEKITIGNDDGKLSSSSLGGCMVKEVEIRKNVKEIGMYTLSQYGIETIIIPDSISEIDERAFGYSPPSSLKKIVLKGEEIEKLEKIKSRLIEINPSFENIITFQN